MNKPFRWAGRILLCLTVLGCATGRATTAGAQGPNIVFILCDDLGYGDVRCNNPRGKIATPNIDRLAEQGLRFTDAHTTSSVCTPTRYSLLTGRYNWRSRLQSGVLGGLSPSLIEPGRMTVASLLKQHGYHTAAVGKWHLGMDWVQQNGQPELPRNTVENSNQVWSVDFSRPILSGPNRLGFDYFFGISASLDMVPYTFIENDRVAALPTVEKAFPMMLGQSNKWTRRGPAARDFEAENVLPTLARKAVDYLNQRASQAAAGQPFFLYVPFASPHTPIAPTARWRGRSGLSYYADFVMETDWAVGQILGALDRQGFTTNTLVIFTSDNGCSPEANIPQLRAAGHDVNGPLRGHKADIWDGGHRVPFIVRWPGRVRAGATSDRLICLVDFMATCAQVVGVKLPDNAGEDSVSFLPILLGQEGSPGREALVHHSIQGRFAIRKGPWKLELCAGSGGWSAPRDPEAARQKLPLVQLYQMTDDLGEQRNLQAARPEMVAELTALLEKQVRDGRSTPGQPQTNDVVVDLWKRSTRPSP
jgi:arylsulfatase A